MLQAKIHSPGVAVDCPLALGQPFFYPDLVEIVGRPADDIGDASFRLGRPELLTDIEEQQGHPVVLRLSFD